MVFVLDYLHSRVNAIEYIYAIIIVIALSNLAIIQMVKTKKSLIYFFIWDILIYQFIVSIIRFVLLGVYAAFTGPKYNSTEFNLVKILILIILIVVYHLVSVDFIINTKKNTRLNKTERIKVIIILVLLIITIGYKFYMDTGKDFARGIKEASKTGIVTIYDN